MYLRISYYTSPFEKIVMLTNFEADNLTKCNNGHQKVRYERGEKVYLKLNSKVCLITLSTHDKIGLNVQQNMVRWSSL